MHMRTRGALVVFIGLVVAFAVIFSFDYTGSYVSDRFHKAVSEAQPDSNRSFSLDAFMEYYDWDTVCVVLPGTEHVFTSRLGRDYAHQSSDENFWNLVLLKGDTVAADIRIDRAFLEYPKDMEEPCLDRWRAVFLLKRDDSGRLRLHSGGH